MPQHIRKYWGKRHGRQQLNFNWGAINANSIVHVAASEYLPVTDPDAHGGFVDQNHQRFIGAANVTVSNIAPHGAPWDPNNGVTFVVNVDWPSPIYIVTDITVFDEGPAEIQNSCP
ncbi:hypothetical protein, partial [Candidatus Protofrankia datiscae]